MKYKDFFGSDLIVPSDLYVGEKYKDFLGHFEVAFLLMDLIEDFSCEFLRNTLFNI
jgi:hypothetical protein